MPIRRTVALGQLISLTLGGAFLVTAWPGPGEADALALATFHGDGFSIDLPGTPQSSVLHIGKLTVVVDLVERSRSATGISYADFPHGAPLNLNSVLKGTASASNGTIHNDVLTTYQGFPARDARISGDAHHKVTDFVRVIGTPTRFYELQYIVIGRHRTKAPAEYAGILASLKIA